MAKLPAILTDQQSYLGISAAKVIRVRHKFQVFLVKLHKQVGFFQLLKDFLVRVDVGLHQLADRFKLVNGFQ